MQKITLPSQAVLKRLQNVKLRRYDLEIKVKDIDSFAEVLLANVSGLHVNAYKKTTLLAATKRMKL